MHVCKKKSIRVVSVADAVDDDRAQTECDDDEREDNVEAVTPEG